MGDVERDGRRSLAPFGALVYEPANNIYVHPNDTIYLYRDPQTFLALGASRAINSRFLLAHDRILVGRAVHNRPGGSRLRRRSPKLEASTTTDPTRHRYFCIEVKRAMSPRLMGVDRTPFDGPIIPIIYVINLRDPAGYFLATTFEMRNKDVIYVSNAYSVENTKFLNVFENYQLLRSAIRFVGHQRLHS